MPQDSKGCTAASDETLITTEARAPSGSGSDVDDGRSLARCGPKASRKRAVR
jgi:hypothetical protein